MPEYVVVFPHPVVYLTDHFKRREITTLNVNAPNPTYALQHALRVTSGDPGEVQVVNINDYVPPPPPIEAPNEICSTCGVEKTEGHICVR